MSESKKDDVILDVKNLKTVFFTNSGSEAVAQMNQLRRERDDWQAAYLRGA